MDCERVIPIMRIAMYKLVFIVNCIFALSAIPFIALGGQITLSGTVRNLDYSNHGRNVRVYLPAFPFIGDDPTRNWVMLGETTYDAATGAYSLTLNVPVGATDIIIAASYGDGHTDVTKSISIVDKTSVFADLSLVDPAETELSFKFRIYYADVEFDYNKSHSCMVANSTLVPDGRIVLFSIFNAVIYSNKVYNLPPNEYRIACSIKNLSGGEPRVLRRVVTVTLPLVDANGIPLSETERVVDLQFGGNSENGTIF